MHFTIGRSSNELMAYKVDFVGKLCGQHTANEFNGEYDVCF